MRAEVNHGSVLELDELNPNFRLVSPAVAIPQPGSGVPQTVINQKTNDDVRPSTSSSSNQKNANSSTEQIDNGRSKLFWLCNKIAHFKQIKFPSLQKSQTPFKMGHLQEIMGVTLMKMGHQEMMVGMTLMKMGHMEMMMRMTLMKMIHLKEVVVVKVVSQRRFLRLHNKEIHTTSEREMCQ